MKTFHHGGRIGDLFYALYTMKALGGGRLLLSNYHSPNWDLNTAGSLINFLMHQPYIHDVALIDYEDYKKLDAKVDYDLQHAEDDFNPEAFPEWTGPHWPGNCHIAKRYAVHFGVEWDPETVWLEAPVYGGPWLDTIVVHAPTRRLARSVSEFGDILWQLGLSGVNVVVLGGPDDVSDLKEYVGRRRFFNTSFLQTSDFLQTATVINSAKAFLGVASSCNVVAEGLKKLRFVELRDDCFNTYPYGKTGRLINNLEPKQIVEEILKETGGI